MEKRSIVVQLVQQALEGPSVNPEDLSKRELKVFKEEQAVKKERTARNAGWSALLPLLDDVGIRLVKHLVSKYRS
jgi:hypothetical protein